MHAYIVICPHVAILVQTFKFTFTSTVPPPHLSGGFVFWARGIQFEIVSADLLLVHPVRAAVRDNACDHPDSDEEQT